MYRNTLSSLWSACSSPLLFRPVLDSSHTFPASSISQIVSPPSYLTLQSYWVLLYMKYVSFNFNFIFEIFLYHGYLLSRSEHCCLYNQQMTSHKWDQKWLIQWRIRWHNSIYLSSNKFNSYPLYSVVGWKQIIIISVKDLTASGVVWNFGY